MPGPSQRFLKLWCLQHMFWWPVSPSHGRAPVRTHCAMPAGACTAGINGCIMQSCLVWPLDLSCLCCTFSFLSSDLVTSLAPFRFSFSTSAALHTSHNEEHPRCTCGWWHCYRCGGYWATHLWCIAMNLGPMRKEEASSTIGLVPRTVTDCIWDCWFC